MDWKVWYSLGVLLTFLVLFRRPSDWRTAILLFVASFLFPILWFWIIWSGVSVAFAKIKRGGSH